MMLLLGTLAYSAFLYLSPLTATLLLGAMAAIGLVAWPHVRRWRWFAPKR